MMTVGELIKELQQFDPKCEVSVCINVCEVTQTVSMSYDFSVIAYPCFNKDENEGRDIISIEPSSFPWDDED
jgi:hypothetical protein